jgi:hemerythrin
MHIAWDPQLSVGYREIDEQHQELFRRVDGLVRALHRGVEPPEVKELLTFLGQYVHEHFGAEEGLMVLFDYPKAAIHRAEHRAFVRAFVEMEGQLEQEGPSRALGAQLGGYLLGWLHDHIGRSDRELGKHLLAAQARGGASRPPADPAGAH